MERQQPMAEVGREIVSDATQARSRIEEFVGKLDESLRTDRFVKLTLSEPRNRATRLRNVYGRVVKMRDGRKVSLLWRYENRDETKNVSFEQSGAVIRRALTEEFLRARLFTLTGDWVLRINKSGKETLEGNRPTFTDPAGEEHDREKSRVVERCPPFFAALGLATEAGEIRAGMADKARQIHRFIELLAHLVADSELRGRSDVSVYDMGCGKGYLTFAAAEYFRSRGVRARVTGLELRKGLVVQANAAARKCGYEGLHFEEGEIAGVRLESGVDVVMALHACDTATDEALYQGIRSGAPLIIAAPCCHKQLRSQLTPPRVVKEVLRHGILLEREAEILTDGIRGLLLEIAGYEASVFEFISTEHTAKNLMITGKKRARAGRPEAARERLHRLLEFYGIREQRLARLMGEIGGVEC